MSQGYPPPPRVPPPYSSGQDGVPYPPRQVRVQSRVSQPTITYTLIGINAAVFLLQLASQTFAGVDYLAALGMKANNLILQGQYWRLLTPMFLHASILHIGFNMYALFVLGPGLERQYGHGRFLLLFVLSGFAGNVLSFLFSPYPSLGASTAIFGLIGAEIVFFYQNRKIYGQNARRALINIITIAAINLMIGLSPGMNIDNWGHIGGLVGGTLFAWFAGPALKVEGIYPELSVVDSRDSRDVLLAGLGVGLFFLILAGIKIFYQGGLG
jgi:rhomboid protease GluP